MLPDLQSSLICDDVRQERNGKFILIGLFDMLNMPTFPIVLPKLCVVNRWVCGSGEFEQKSRIMKPDGHTVLVEGQMVRLVLPDSESTATSVEFFMNVSFEQEGTYWVEILQGGDLKIRYPMRARRIPPPPGAQPGVPGAEAL